jgi:hypothetical protein
MATTALARRLHGRRLTWALAHPRLAAMKTQEMRLAGQDNGTGIVWPLAAPGMVDI